MNKQGETMAAGDDAVTGLAAMARRAGAFRGPAPVHLWNPPACGSIDIRIDGHGVWYHEGVAIRREPMVRLFAGILRRESNGDYALVTPAEKLIIRVDDVPFLAVEMATGGGVVSFRTNVGDLVSIDVDHPLRVEIGEQGAFVPFVTVRPGLEARLTRSVAIELFDAAIIEHGHFGIRSGGHFFVIGPADGVSVS